MTSPTLGPHSARAGAPRVHGRVLPTCPYRTGAQCSPKGTRGGAQQKGQTGGSSSSHLGLCPASSSSLSPKCPLVPAHPPPCSLSGAGSWPPSSVGNCPLGLPPGLSPSPTLVWLLKPPALTAPLAVLPEDWTLSRAIANPSQLAQTRDGREHELNINEADFLIRFLTLHLETEKAADRARTTDLNMNAQPTSCLAMSRVPWALPKPPRQCALAERSSRRPHMSPRPDSQGDAWPGPLEGRAASPSFVQTAVSWMPQICPDCLLPASCSSTTLPRHHRPGARESRCTLGPERRPVGGGKGAVNQTSKEELQCGAVQVRPTGCSRPHEESSLG